MVDPILQEIKVLSQEKPKGIKVLEKQKSDFFLPSNEKAKSCIKVNFDYKSQNDNSLTKTSSLKVFPNAYSKKDLFSHHSKNNKAEINLYTETDVGFKIQKKKVLEKNYSNTLIATKANIFSSSSTDTKGYINKTKNQKIYPSAKDNMNSLLNYIGPSNNNNLTVKPNQNDFNAFKKHEKVIFSKKKIYDKNV